MRRCVQTFGLYCISKSTQKWFSKNKIHVPQWISQTQHLNPIKNLWSKLKRGAFEKFCMEERSNIPPNLFSILITNYRKRLIHGCHLCQELNLYFKGFS